MRVEWFFNGKPITIGSRFKTYFDFGFVALDVIGVTSLDSGEYTVRATNHLGSAHTSACVRINSRSDVLTESQHESNFSFNLLVNQVNIFVVGYGKSVTISADIISAFLNYCRQTNNFRILKL